MERTTYVSPDQAMSRVPEKVVSSLTDGAYDRKALYCHGICDDLGPILRSQESDA